MAFGFNSDKSKVEVIPKSEQYGNNIEQAIEIPKNKITSVAFTVDYTFPSDGYVTIQNTTAELAPPFAEWSCELQGANGYHAMPILACQKHGNDYDFLGINLFVKKGMKILCGYAHIASEEEQAKIIFKFYPLNSLA